ncbi:hypothetical protein JB92DRAFT_2835089 [Gautieria morchelliformis]|nr:hypothetical protein JB92DRAFT_2835089 [Gautieria morchelliformis]
MISGVDSERLSVLGHPLGCPPDKIVEGVTDSTGHVWNVRMTCVQYCSVQRMQPQDPWQCEAKSVQVQADELRSGFAPGAKHRPICGSLWNTLTTAPHFKLFRLLAIFSQLLRTKATGRNGCCHSSYLYHDGKRDLFLHRGFPPRPLRHCEKRVTGQTAQRRGEPSSTLPDEREPGDDSSFAPDSSEVIENGGIMEEESDAVEREGTKSFPLPLDGDGCKDRVKIKGEGSHLTLINSTAVGD